MLARKQLDIRPPCSVEEIERPGYVELREEGIDGRASLSSAALFLFHTPRLPYHGYK